MDSTVHSGPSKEALTERQRLEQRKLELGNADLGRPRSKRPAMVTPRVAALVSIALGYYTGWCDVQSKRLENQRSALKLDIDEFTKNRNTVERQVTAARADLKKAK